MIGGKAQGTEQDRALVESFLDMMSAERGASPNTIAAYRRDDLRGAPAAVPFERLEIEAPLVAKGADEKLSQPLSDAVTAHIAGMPGIARADSFKITVAEMRKFLYFLPLELGIELGFSAAA